MHVGQVISGKYRLIRLLGDGGMGSVYEALHEKLGTRVAIKFLHTDLARRTGLADRFLREARVAAQIRSPHVVHVTDIDTTPEGEAYIVMELLEGEPLSSVLEREHKVPTAVACDYTRQILEALEAAHALGVVHRDLKPENVFVTFVAGKPVLKLIDFGIAKLRQPEGLQTAPKNLTVAGVLMGTAEYMAPEQAFSADRVDARSDVYSVGVMLYEMLAGQRPVSGDDARVIALKVERGEVTPLVHVAPHVQREIAGFVHRAMAARPELRFQSAAEMRLALEQVLSGRRPPTVPLPSVEQEAGTGTVMGAPADALLARGAPAATPDASLKGGTARVAPVPSAIIAPNLAEPPRRRRGGTGLLLGLAFVIGAAAVGAIVVSQYDVLGGDTTPAPPTPSSPALNVPAPSAPTAPAATARPAAPGDSIAPLVTPPVRPSPPRPPSSRPHASSSPSAPPAPTDTVPPMPTILPMPSFPIPIPIPSGSAPIVLPTTLPSFPIPIPGFGPPPQPAPSTSSGS